MNCDLLIAGQGLAGTLLAWEAHWAGLRVVIVDPDEKQTASKVAAGIVNPITGRRLTRSWRFDEFHPAAIGFYRRAEQDLGRIFYHPQPILRCLDGEEMIGRWKRKSRRPDYRHLWSDDPHLARAADPYWFLPCGFRFATDRSGYLEIDSFLAASRAFFTDRQQVITATLDPEAIDPGDREGRVAHLGITARHVVLCLGGTGRDPRFFDALPLRRVKGEILTVELAGCREDRIVNRGGKWLLPTGAGRFLAGATYRWDVDDKLPSDDGREEILRGMRSITSKAPTILGHRAGIRPVIRGSRPVIGRHPVHPVVSVFNGLGSKGVLNGPWFAAKLIRHLIAGEPLDPETDVRSHMQA